MKYLLYAEAQMHFFVCFGLNIPKGVIGIRKSKKDKKHNGQKDKQRSTKHTHKHEN